MSLFLSFYHGEGHGKKAEVGQLKKKGGGVLTTDSLTARAVG